MPIAGFGGLPLAAFAAPENPLFPAASNHSGLISIRPAQVLWLRRRAPRSWRSNPIWLTARALRTPSTLGGSARVYIQVSWFYQPQGCLARAVPSTPNSLVLTSVNVQPKARAASNGSPLFIT